MIQHRDELEAQRHELQRLALYDVVTGLGNRVLLRNRGTDLGPDLDDTTLLLLDLDGFKEVNDTLGHALGDGLLRQVADRLMTCVREQDTVVRLGGDEFAVLLPNMGAWAAARTADRLLDVLRRPFTRGPARGPDPRQHRHRGGRCRARPRRAAAQRRPGDVPGQGGRAGPVL